MAKKTETETTTDPTPAAPPSVSQSQEKPTEAPVVDRYLVDVACPTPLAHNPVIVKASNEAEAWAKFCKANGISGTDHPKTITKQ